MAQLFGAASAKQETVIIASLKLRPSFVHIFLNPIAEKVWASHLAPVVKFSRVGVVLLSWITGDNNRKGTQNAIDAESC